MRNTLPLLVVVSSIVALLGCGRQAVRIRSEKGAVNDQATGNIDPKDLQDVNQPSPTPGPIVVVRPAIGQLALSSESEGLDYGLVVSGTSPGRIFTFRNLGTAPVAGMNFILPAQSAFVFDPSAPGLHCAQTGLVLLPGESCVAAVVLRAVLAPNLILSGPVSAPLTYTYYNSQALVTPDPLVLSAVVTVPRVNVTLTASAASIPYDRSVTLNWSASHSTGCVLLPGNVSLPASGTREMRLLSTTDFVMTCDGPGGAQAKSVHVDVIPRPTVTLVAESPTISYYGLTYLVWESQNATNCALNTGQGGVRGRQSTGPLRTAQNYSVTCTNASGSVTAAVSVQVNRPAFCAVLYRDRNFGGRSATLNPGASYGDLDDLWSEHQTSSVRVHPGCTLTLWEDEPFRSWTAVYTADTAHIGAMEDDEESAACQCP